MKLSLYIARTLISSILLVFIVFFGLILFLNLIGELKETGAGNYHFLQAVHYVLFTLPLFLYQLFPPVVLIGVLLGLGTLASHSELVIMRSATMSLLRIATIALLAALVIIAVITLLGETIVPAMARYANDVKKLQRNNSQLATTVYGVWLREDNIFFYISRITSVHQIYGVSRFQFNQQHHLQTASHADSATLRNKQWVFNNVSTSIISEHSITQRKQQQVIWPLTFNLHQFHTFDPTTLNLLVLYRQIGYGKINKVNVVPYQFIFWKRLFQPLTTLIMVLVAIPFVFGPLRSVGVGLRLLSGIAVGLIFYILNQLLTSFGMVYQISPIIAALLLPGLFLLFALFLFWRRA